MRSTRAPLSRVEPSPHGALAVLLVLAGAAGASTGPGAGLAQRLTGSAPAPSGSLGRSVDVAGDVMVAGQTGTAEVVVFHRAGGAWSEVQRLTDPDPMTFGFGTDVAVDGDVLVVGGGHGSSLSSWVYERSGSTWLPVQRLDFPGAEVFPTAVSVAVSGDRFAVGAPLESDLSDRGHVRTYVRCGGAWCFEEEVQHALPQDDDYFGWSVDLDDDRMIVGAYGVAGPSTQSGAAFLFEHSGGSWSQVGKIVDAAASGNDALGWSVAIDGDRAAAGARFASPSGVDTGLVLTIERLAGTWTAGPPLVPGAAQSGDWFGYAVDVEGDRLVAGSPRAAGSAALQGTATLFAWDGAAWCEGDTLAADDPTGGARFGEDVALSSADVGVGAYGGESAPGQVTGLVYAYGAGDVLGTSYCVAGTNSLGLQASIRALGSVLVADDDLHLVATDAVPDRSAIFFFGPAQVQVPLGAGFRCVGGGVRRLGPLLTTDDAGGAYRRVDLTSDPALSAIAQAAPVTMNFQLWYRDSGTTNLTDAVSVAFQ